MKDRINVRCCCQPQKILGTLPAPHGSADRIVLQFPDRFVTLPLAKFGVRPMVPDRVRAVTPEHVLKMMLPEDELAYKSEGLTVEELKRISGFEPA